MIFFHKKFFSNDKLSVEMLLRRNLNHNWALAQNIHSSQLTKI